jgi:pyridoxamine 5'-phosphate oxidase
MATLDTQDIRREYQYGSLRRSDLDDDPVAQFKNWLETAMAEPAILDPTAMVLATVNPAGQPHLRTVLLKDFSTDGFTFFTNLESHKARDININDQVSLLFQWLPLSRQVIIGGTVARTDRAEDEAYFARRPRDSQLAAWASHQSAPINNRHTLEQAFTAQQERFSAEEIPCPPNWGGYCVTPLRLEFWQGRPNRLHDRLVYQRQGKLWTISRLSP